MSVNIKEQWLSSVTDQLEAFYTSVDEKIEKEQQQLKASKKQTELEMKLAHELKLNHELTERLAELSRRSSELDRVCAAFESRLTIADSDRNRLDNAKEMYQLAKELTGIRLDFSAPQNVCKGYVKSEHRKQLQPFEFPSKNADAALWALLQSIFLPVGDENTPHNI
ncbi:unnamed protein product [Diatraea saccharalis]|uniref:Uncharacterized protein n=1 Tax=Diatraea saccharalis TaxID=40085 RepID=A0A9N9WEQ8_9NEOP|nr:unnamed protein product [Diatraea saccharalis]